MSSGILLLNYKSRQIEFATYMKECELYNVGKDTTYYRRASTIKAWIYWIINLVTE